MPGIPPRRVLFMPAMAWAATLIAMIAMAFCYALTGPTLGLFFGGIVFAALLVPPLCLTETRMLDRLLIAGAINDGIAVIWLIAVFTSPVSLLQWLLCYILLIAWCLALCGISHLLWREKRSIGAIPVAALVSAMALAWITWPIWLGPRLTDHPATIAALVTPHPLFAVNGILRNLGIWSERPIAYRDLLTLGQDVPYELPRSILPAIVLHATIGAIGLLLGWFGSRWTRRSTNQTDAAASTNIAK